MHLKLVVFDLDGTLFTSDAIVHQAYQTAVTEFNRVNGTTLPVPSLMDILNQLGNTPRTLYKNLFPNVQKEHLPALSHSIRGHLITAIRADKGRLLPGVKETLMALSETGLELRVASNGHKDYIEAVLDHYHLSPLFGPPVYLNHTDINDKGDILNLYKSLLGIHAEEMVMMGDRRSDYLAAKKAGCNFIGITQGHGAREEIDVPGALLLDNFTDLPRALLMEVQ